MKISEASKQQLALAQIQLQSLLHVAKSDDNYEIVKTQNHIGIRENINKRPTAEQKKLVMQLLKIHPLFEKLSTATMGAQSTPAILIAELDENYLGQPAITPIKKMPFNQQQVLKANLLKILKTLDVDKHYWVYSDGEDLMVCESSKTPPAEPIKTLVLDVLKMHPLFYKLAVASIPLDNSKYPAFLIRQIDQAPMAGKKPEKMDGNIWTHMPFEIKRRWSQFNPELQQYLVQYVQTLISQVQQAQTDKDANSVDLSFFPFSVRLPSASPPTAAATSAGAAPAAGSGMNNAVPFDLLKLLVIEDRDPKNVELRRHPLFKNNYFSLLDICPPAAPVASLSPGRWLDMASVDSPSFHASDSGAAKGPIELDEMLRDLGIRADDKSEGFDDKYDGADDERWVVDSVNGRRGSRIDTLDSDEDLWLEGVDMVMAAPLSLHRLGATKDSAAAPAPTAAFGTFIAPTKPAPVNAVGTVASAAPIKPVPDVATGTPAPAAPTKPVPVAAAGASVSAAPAKPVPVAVANTSASAAPAKPVPVAAADTSASATPAKPVLVAATGASAPAAASQAKLGLFGSIWKAAGSVANTAANIFSSTNGING